MQSGEIDTADWGHVIAQIDFVSRAGSITGPAASSRSAHRHWTTIGYQFRSSVKSRGWIQFTKAGVIIKTCCGAVGDDQPMGAASRLVGW